MGAAIANRDAHSSMKGQSGRLVWPRADGRDRGPAIS